MYHFPYRPLEEGYSHKPDEHFVPHPVAQISAENGVIDKPIIGTDGTILDRLVEPPKKLRIRDTE